VNDTPLGQLVPRRVSDEFYRLNELLDQSEHRNRLLKELVRDLVAQNGKLAEEIRQYEQEYDRSGDVGSEE